MKTINSLRSAAELSVTKPCGTRIKYMGGCRCLPCRAANSRYESERKLARDKGEWNGLVPADKARKHILALSEKNIGYKTVADAAGMSFSVVFKIRSGQRKQIRALNEKKILSVDADAIADKALVPAKETWSYIRKMLNADGFTEPELARRLGFVNPVIHFGEKQVTAATALKVKKFYEMIHEGDEPVNYQDDLRTFLNLK